MRPSRHAGHARLASLAALAAASVLVLAGCAGTDAAATDDGRIVVVASTNVYGQIAEEIGGDLVDVTSIVSSTAQDPHAFEPSAQDQLTLCFSVVRQLAHILVDDSCRDQWNGHA